MILHYIKIIAPKRLSILLKQSKASFFFTLRTMFYLPLSLSFLFSSSSTIYYFPSSIFFIPSSTFIFFSLLKFFIPSPTILIFSSPQFFRSSKIFKIPPTPSFSSSYCFHSSYYFPDRGYLSLAFSACLWPFLACLVEKK